MPGERIGVGVVWNLDSRHVKWGSIVVEETSWSDALLRWKLETCILKRHDLWASEISTKHDRLDGRNRRFVLTIRKRDDPLATRAFHTMLDVVRAEEKLLWFPSLE